MKQSNIKSRHRKGGKVILATAIVFLFAGAAAVVIPVIDENETLSRDENAYEELAEELKTATETPYLLSDEEEMPQTEPEQEEPDTTLIHPPNSEDNAEESDTSELLFPDQPEVCSPDENDAIPTDMPETAGTPSPRPSTDGSPTTHPANGNTGANLSACVAKNSDFVAWLKIPGTNVDYPVVLTDSPDYYLSHSFTGQISKLGTLFSLGKTDYETPGRNIAIYGHHITNTSSGQKMFRPLFSYKQKSFWEKHQTVYLDSLYHISTYRVFAVIDMVNGEWDPSTASFSSDSDFLNFIRQAQSQSLYDTGVTVSASDHILTLITCDRSYASKQGRLVVMAVEQ